jgi:hypothetical protein
MQFRSIATPGHGEYAGLVSSQCGLRIRADHLNVAQGTRAPSAALATDGRIGTVHDRLHHAFLRTLQGAPLDTDVDHSPPDRLID